MSAVLLAVFNEHAIADRVHTQLVSDGFPTDRVELTSTEHPGKAQAEPADSRRAKFAQYFRTLFGEERERSFIEALVERIDRGAAAVAVHPRGNIETARAAEILTHAGAVELKSHDLQDQFLEQAASREQGYWVRHLLPETLTGER